MILLTYIFVALLSLIDFAIPFINKFGITLVYKLPGPITIASASIIASITPGAGLVFVGVIYTLCIFLPFLLTSSGIIDLSSTTLPSSNSAQILIGSNVTGITFPVIFKIFPALSIDELKLPFTSVIPAI